MTTLLDEYQAISTVPHRDTVLRLILGDYVGHYGPDTPLDLDRLNSLLAARRQPLATLVEINAFYGDTLPAAALNRGHARHRRTEKQVANERPESRICK